MFETRIKVCKLKYKKQKLFLSAENILVLFCKNMHFCSENKIMKQSYSKISLSTSYPLNFLRINKNFLVLIFNLLFMIKVQLLKPRYLKNWYFKCVKTSFILHPAICWNMQCFVQAKNYYCFKNTFYWQNWKVMMWIFQIMKCLICYYGNLLQRNSKYYWHLKVIESLRCSIKTHPNFPFTFCFPSTMCNI